MILRLLLATTRSHPGFEKRGRASFSSAPGYPRVIQARLARGRWHEIVAGWLIRRAKLFARNLVECTPGVDSCKRRVEDMDIRKIRRFLYQAERLLGAFEGSRHGHHHRRHHHRHGRRRGIGNKVLRQILRRIR